jgi:hypothetical protein
MTEAAFTHNHVICTDFDGGEALLVDLNTKRYYQLNETALLIWKGLEKGQSVDDIVADMVDAYSVELEHAKRSVADLMNKLHTQKLITSDFRDRV